MSDAVQQIKDKLSILDVISPYVELHKAGKNFKGKSPFSAEKTPSFYVSPDRGMYYCFSTSQGGDMFNFIQAMEGVDFKEALKILAQKAGVELVPEDPKKRSERERLYAALEAATVFYEEQLPKEAEAVSYLKRRGVKEETIAKWRIGFAPGPPKAGWREAKDALEGQGFTKDELLKAGIIKSAEGGKEPFDVFRDRVMFPMAEPSGKVVAFSGRILHPDEKAPKYVNSPETVLYKKSELLFGYDKAKEGIRKLNFSLIVEGQFDVVMCHQAGYHNAVAVSGTALTQHHVQLLERLSDKVVLALDADRAGIAAMKKAAEVMLRRGLDVKVAEMPLGKDPADMIVENAADFKKVIGHSVHVIEFMLHVIIHEEKDERTMKRRAREEVIPFILLLPDRIDQEHFVGKVATAIDTTVDAVRFELERLREQATERPASESRTSTPVAKRPNTATNMPQKAYVYLLAAVEVIEPAVAKKVTAAITEIETLGDLQQPDESERAGVLFTLEQQFATMPPLAVAEDVVAKLNQLRVGLIRRRLATLRAELLEQAATLGEVAPEQVLATIKEFETELREPAYQTETFLAT
ncbi:DNA primase [Candidatus Kaiserbacteria bacterium]|nr:DNA primase [Candidatus Kaiserbacteria bacterium]MCB9812670.1 DNA primase [Candidatus Nomurabacteria bacterium]